jgi:hypothetical protein
MQDATPQYPTRGDQEEIVKGAESREWGYSTHSRQKRAKRVVRVGWSAFRFAHVRARGESKGGVGEIR